MRCNGELDAMVSLELQGEEMGVEIVWTIAQILVFLTMRIDDLFEKIKEPVVSE